MNEMLRAGPDATSSPGNRNCGVRNRLKPPPCPSMIVSGVRCTLAYVVLPFVAPLIGLAPGVGLLSRCHWPPSRPIDRFLTCRP